MRLTDRGQWASALAAALWCVALVRGSFWAASAASVVTLTLVLSAAALDRPRIHVDRVLARDHVVEGDAIEETFRIQNAGRRRAVTLVESCSEGVEALGGSNSIDVELPRHHESSHAISWKAVTWGKKRFGPLRVVARDVLGLLEVESIEATETTIRVEPAPQALGRFKTRASNPELSIGAHIVSKPGDSSDFFALRDYQAGDSIRSVNWKASARSSKMIVNQATRDTYARVLIVVDLRAKEAVGPHAESPLVRNVRVAASLIAHHDRSRDHLQVVTVGGEANALSMNRNPRRSDLLDALAECAPGGDLPTDAAIREWLRNVRPRSPVYFVTSCAMDPELLDAIMLVQALKAFPVVISPSLPPFEDPGGAYARTRAATIDAVRSAGVPVHDWRHDTLLGVSLTAV